MEHYIVNNMHETEPPVQEEFKSTVNIPCVEVLNMGNIVYAVLRSACTDLVLALEREENFMVHVVSGK